ncbi:Galactosyltransferase [Nesidiocoris tenuis]|uniref:Hexosyltransferase n=1 Tax=Nesidiocoris tenuis TaxID=355587 RepID=A0ABN7A8S9_9HEMI|nr:Galactosyltransferase [Nesidiocoris tenuis]
MHSLSTILPRGRRKQCVLLLGLFVLYYLGVFAMLFQTSIINFNYPLHEPVDAYVKYWLDNKYPIREPINIYNYSFIHSPSGKCAVDADSKLRLVYLVKSAAPHFHRREAIRKSWGFEKRFSDVEVRTIFILGVPDDSTTQQKINEESSKTGDIVQADFRDNYFNNTVKTMTAISWALKYCSLSKFYFFSDDDMYVSTKNAIRFTRNPLNYPRYLEEEIASIIAKKEKMRGPRTAANDSRSLNRSLKQIVDIDLPDDAELYAGYVFASSRPHRHQSSKWYLPLAEYPYDFFPPYVTAGSYILSNVVLQKFYYASFYVKNFRFDDIYLGILAKKMNIVPLHSEEFFFYKKPYDVFGYRYVVASHGYSDPAELLTVWEQQKSAGNA